jgi:hypothetical protein
VLGIALIAVALSAVGAGAYFVATVERPPVLNKISLCPMEGPRAATVILLDASDALPDVTRREVSKYLLDAAEQVPPYGLLEIRLLDPNEPSGRAVFAKCNPGDGSGVSEYTANPAMARKRWMEGFKAPIEQALERGLGPSDTATSPILSTLQSIAVDRFAGRAAAEMPKLLIVVSDLIEHSPDYSQYQGSLSYERFRDSNAYRRVRTDLNGAEVSFRYIQRITKKPINSADHIKFWAEWVKDSNGRFKEARKLQGAG